MNHKENVDFVKAVEEFVDTIVENADINVYNVVSKKLLGESLEHDEVMLDSPQCCKKDLVIVEKNGQFEFNISTDQQIRILISRLKLGRDGLRNLWNEYQRLLKIGNTRPEFAMAKAAQHFNVDVRSAQIILTKMEENESKLAESYITLAGVLNEETPVNTSGGGMPDHKPTDGRPCGKPLRRKKKVKELLKDDEEEV
jgi:hypothetical protein